MYIGVSAVSGDPSALLVRCRVGEGLKSKAGVTRQTATDYLTMVADTGKPSRQPGRILGPGLARKLFRSGHLRLPKQDWTLILAGFNREMHAGPRPDYNFRSKPLETTDLSNKQGLSSHFEKEFRILNSILGDNIAMLYFPTFSPGLKGRKARDECFMG